MNQIDSLIIILTLSFIVNLCHLYTVNILTDIQKLFVVISLCYVTFYSVLIAIFIDYSIIISESNDIILYLMWVASIIYSFAMFIRMYYGFFSSITICKDCITEMEHNFNEWNGTIVKH